MKLQSFIEAHSSEEACKGAFKQYRLTAGVTCKKCGSKKHYWLSTIEQFKCKQCGFRTTLRSGTVMEASKLPFQYWFFAMYFMTMTKKGISAKELQRQLGHKRYEPVWLMMHKLRLTMGKRDDAYRLAGSVEMDEAFFETVNEIDKSQELKRGRGSQRQTKVLVMAESEEVKSKKHHRTNKRCGYFKMKVIENTEAGTINREVEKAVEPTAVATTDKYTCYSKLKEVVAEHQAVKCLPKEAHKLLPWVHTAIGNAKRTLLCAYHRIDGKYLQNYLNEFCYRLNRRYFGLDIFERLAFAVAALTWYN